MSTKGNGGGGFAVKVRKKEVVAAVLPLQEHWLPLSNLDLLLPPLDVGVFLCYNKKPQTTFESMVSVLKKAMAQVLVSYYAFGGEVVANPMGEPELLCNNRGVEFVEAFADVQLKDLNLYNPDHTVEAKLVPKKKGGVLAIQATELTCGGIVIGCTFDHRIADAYSTNMFLVSWAETAQSKPISISASFRRSVLNPRRPIHLIDPSFDDTYVPISSILPPKESEFPDNHVQNCLISRIYYVKSEELINLQTIASSNGIKRTKLESFSAFLWQFLTKFANKGNMKMSAIGVVVDGRSRLSDKMMERYFGNVLSLPHRSERCDRLVNYSLSQVADTVHAFLEKTLTEEHFLGLIDWVEANRPLEVVAKIYAHSKEDGPAFVVSSGQRFPVCKLDFGWGMPIFGSYHFPWGGNTGYVMPMPSPLGNGDWVLYMHLFPEQLEYVESEAPSFFKPFKFNYVDQILNSQCV